MFNSITNLFLHFRHKQTLHDIEGHSSHSPAPAQLVKFCIAIYSICCTLLWGRLIVEFCKVHTFNISTFQHFNICKGSSSLQLWPSHWESFHKHYYFLFSFIQSITVSNWCRCYIVKQFVLTIENKACIKSPSELFWLSMTLEIESFKSTVILHCMKMNKMREINSNGDYQSATGGHNKWSGQNIWVLIYFFKQGLWFYITIDVTEKESKDLILPS